MDEAAQLGLGKYLRENGYTKSSVLIREHTARVFEICKKLGLEPMIWSDMYITPNTGGGYYDVADDTDCSDWEKPDPAYYLSGTGTLLSGTELGGTSSGGYLEHEK